MSQKSVPKSTKQPSQTQGEPLSSRERPPSSNRTESAVMATDLAGKPLKSREYVHLRDKPDFYEHAPNPGKGEGLYKKLHDIPFALKVEDSLRIKTGRKRLNEPRAQFDVPLKIGGAPVADEPSKRQGKRQIAPLNLPSKRGDRGKRILGQPNGESVRASSAKNRSESKSVPRETMEYMRLQLEKQRTFEQELDRETAYRRKTPERRNVEVMDSIMAYKYVKFPDDKLTDKINRIKVPDASERSLSARRSSSYYGKRCR